MKRYVLAITGATGAVIGLRVLKTLLRSSEVHLILSAPAPAIIKEETGVDLSERPPEAPGGEGRLFVYRDDDLWAPLTSGSFTTEGMLVVPCSMKTLSAIAHGYAQGLVERAADVTLKEGRRLILSPRETPFSAIHLENMLRLARIGVRIVPPVAGFYHKPENLEEMIDFLAGRILDQIPLEHDLYRRWSG